MELLIVLRVHHDDKLHFDYEVELLIVDVVTTLQMLLLVMFMMKYCLMS